jgi:hypothetical protein
VRILTLLKSQQTPLIDAVQAALMLGVITTEAPFLRWIGPHIPLKSVQKLFAGENIIFEHGALAVRNMRSENANTRNLFGQMLAQADSQEKTDLTDSTVSASPPPPKGLEGLLEVKMEILPMPRMHT